MSYTTIIIEDDESCQLRLIELIEAHFDNLVLLNTADNIEKGRELIDKLDPDIIFLDIEMPGGTGIELLNRLENRSVNVIFTTSHDSYALEALRLSAIDYLMKPIQLKELVVAVDKAIKKLKNDQILDHVGALLSHTSSDEHKNKTIALPSGNGYVFLKIDHIIRCEADGNYTVVHLADGSNLVITQLIKNIEQLLQNHPFFRTHQSHLINMDHIREYQRGTGGTLVMSDASLVPISRSKRQAFLDKVGG